MGRLILRDFLMTIYANTYGRDFGVEVISDFRVEETYTGNPEEGLVKEHPTAGQAKITIAFNATPMLQVALEQYKDTMGKEKWAELATYSPGNLRMATSFIIQKFGGKRSSAAGPRTQLERTVEADLKALASWSRPR